MRRRIAVLTGGGDAPGLNAVVRAVVKTAIGEYGWEVLGVIDGFDGFIRDGGVLQMTLADVDGILPEGGTILGTANRGNPWVRKQTGPTGETGYVNILEDMVRRIGELGVDGIIVIGGDGTLGASMELVKHGCPVVGVPKTIDNDLGGTDQTFGFDTALTTATDAVDKLHTTAESHRRVIVVEVMGREAGWIAMGAGLAGGADVILIPEMPFKVEAVTKKIKNRSTFGKKFSLVVAAEGAMPAGGQPVYKSAGDTMYTARLGGIGAYVSEQVEKTIGQETRVVVLGHLQRGGRPTPYDRLLGTRYGVAAVQVLADGKSGHMVALRGNEITSVPIAAAVATPKRVDPNGELVRAAKGLGISMGDE
ncbi:MAG TPA: ATP-dependent 6-phosphofructokinase [Anaerolineae bacterium]|nr:ATP-dependent 6-phosphofructokinase [Anaerolineae bacterium]